MSRQALGHIHCHVLWIPRLFPRDKADSYEANYSPQTRVKVKGQFLCFCVNIARPFGTEVAMFHIFKITF